MADVSAQIQTWMARLRTTYGAAHSVPRSDVEKLLTDLAQEQTPQWQPISSAPKDGREVLLLVKLRAGIRGKMLVGHHMAGGHCIEDHPAIDRGWYFWNGCMFDRASEPTHWMPLPPSPVSPAPQGE